jgi:hypothetical protein
MPAVSAAIIIQLLTGLLQMFLHAIFSSITFRRFPEFLIDEFGVV